ncbi:hypothetical protein BAY59_25100 [Prauserella coralliicola]|nr:hypothetical protein BAY59_25100 [Prauserella coralliicola]
MMVSRSNWANMPSICTSIRPIGVEVSNGSVALRNTTPAESSSSSSITMSRRFRENRSTRYTNSTSINPARAAASARCNPSRSVVAPEASSGNRATSRQPGWEPM